MKNNYFQALKRIFSRVEVHDNKAKVLSFDSAVSKIVNLILAQSRKGFKVIFIGNGGSASIASHIATDFLKNAGVPAITFNDPVLITCLSNDLGYEYVFAKSIEMLARKGDILFAISSSGKSKNILNAAKEAKKIRCFLVTLSGFNKENPLRKLGGINFYVSSDSYGYVEIAHLAICHCIADEITQKSNG